MFVQFLPLPHLCGDCTVQSIQECVQCEHCSRVCVEGVGQEGYLPQSAATQTLTLAVCVCVCVCVYSTYVATILPPLHMHNTIAMLT